MNFLAPAFLAGLAAIAVPVLIHLIHRERKAVVAQDTGFGPFIETGEGLMAFTTTDDAVSAIEELRRDYRRHALFRKRLGAGSHSAGRRAR